MIPIIARGLMCLIVLPYILIASPYYHFRYWKPNEMTRERSAYRGSWYTYKKNMKEILFDEDFTL